MSAKLTLAQIFAAPPARPSDDRAELAAMLGQIVREYDLLVAPLAATVRKEMPLWGTMMQAKQLLKQAAS